MLAHSEFTDGSGRRAVVWEGVDGQSAAFVCCSGGKFESVGEKKNAGNKNETVSNVCFISQLHT